MGFCCRRKNKKHTHMKHIFLFFLALTTSLIGLAQQQAAADCNCPKPKDGQFVHMCTLVENQDFKYKNLVLEMSCADPKKDSQATIKAKVNCMWEKYYKEFSCEGEGFISQENILKYSVNQGFEFFIDGMAKDFGVNINLRDPADGKTLLDYTRDYINFFKKNPEYKKKVKELQGIYDHLKNDLKAKHANEL